MNAVDQLEDGAATICEIWFADQPLSQRERAFLADARAVIATGGYLSPRQRQRLESLHARRNKWRRA